MLNLIECLNGIKFFWQFENQKQHVHIFILFAIIQASIYFYLFIYWDLFEVI